jgi:hypothetical protein
MASLDSSRAEGATSRPLDIDREVSLMQAMSVDRLRAKYAQVFGEPTRSRHKEYLIKRIAWRMQANAYGGLSERALHRAMELANLADLRLTAPRQSKVTEDAPDRTVMVRTSVRLGTALLPGTMLKRRYKGRDLHVMVLADGFEFEGQRYKSLTAVAKAVTGKHWNGFHFFGLRQTGGAA